MTGVHRGASQDVPLFDFFCGRCGARRAGLWSSGAAALLREAALLAQAARCLCWARCAVGLVARVAVVRAMHSAPEIRHNNGCKLQRQRPYCCTAAAHVVFTALAREGVRYRMLPLHVPIPRAELSSSNELQAFSAVFYTPQTTHLTQRNRRNTSKHTTLPACGLSPSSP